MKQTINILFFISLFFSSSFLGKLYCQHTSPRNIALVGGNWFNGNSFEPRTMYSINGVFSFKKLKQIDSTIDLSGAFIVPPFADAHNHNIGTGSEELDKKAINRFLEGGVFYVKIQGNLPISAEAKKNLGINEPKNVDVSFSQGSITATGGAPIFIVERIHPSLGYNKGYSKEQLKDFRYYTIDSEEQLDEKWTKIIDQKPDFIKTFLWSSNDYEKLKNDTTVFFKGLDPALLPKIISKAHSKKLKVSVHVTNTADFKNAVVAGADEITHLPRFISGQENEPITVEDAQLAARKGIVVITTVAVSLFQGGMVKEADRALARKSQANNLKLLSENGVAIAIGSDDVSDNSLKEVFYLKELNVFDNLTLLNMWTGTTAKTIFPLRKIGELKEGFEASFIALEGNPIEDLNNLKNIKMLFKQGFLLEQR